jgi:hypothetical protein
MRKQLLCKMLIGSLAACAVLPFAAVSPASGQYGRVSAPPKNITIMGRNLTLRERKGGGMGQGASASYISPSETPDSWTFMFSVYYSPGTSNPAEAAMAAVDKIKMRKASHQDPLASASMFESKDHRSANVDFLVSSTKPKLLEHNVFHYFKSPGGLSSYQIARRIFGTPTNRLEVNQFLSGMQRARVQMFQELARTDLPTWPN